MKILWAVQTFPSKSVHAGVMVRAFPSIVTAIHAPVKIILLIRFLVPAAAGLTVGGTQQLTAAIIPANANNQAVIWSSSNASVASLSVNGLVTGIKSGTSTITAKTVDGNFIGTCIVTVSSVGIYPNPAAETVALNMGQFTNATINVYDMTGKLLIRQNTGNNATQTLNIAKYSGQLVI